MTQQLEINKTIAKTNNIYSGIQLNGNIWDLKKMSQHIF